MSNQAPTRNGGFLWLDLIMTLVMFLGIAYSVGEAPSAADYGHAVTVEARMVQGEPASCALKTP